MLRYVPPNWSILSGSGPESLERAKWLRDEVIAKVMESYPHSTQSAPLVAPLSASARDEVGEAKRLELTPMLFAETTADRASVFYLLGVRDLITTGLTVIFEDESVTDEFSQTFSTRRIGYNRSNPEAARLALRRILERLPSGDDELSSKLQKRFEHLQVSAAGKNAGDTPEATLWRLGGLKTDTTLGVWFGNLVNISKTDGVDVIVNSESIFLEMARFHDPGVSAVLRWRGAGNDRDIRSSNDIIFRELIREATTDRPVQPGYVVFTTSGRLRQCGVKRICHVAAVEPKGWSENEWKAGMGYQPVSNLDDCMKNTLARLETRRFWDKVPKHCTVLAPLFGAGNAKADSRMIASLLVRTAYSHFLAREKSNIKSLMFMARSERDRDICAEAISSLPDAKMLPT